MAIPLQVLALTPSTPDSGVVVYARRNLDVVGKELKATATHFGWECDRPVPTNPLAQNNLILQCRSPIGRAAIIADDYIDPLDRASVQGYSDDQNLEEMRRILREFVRRVSKIPKAQVLFQKNSRDTMNLASP